MLLPWHACSFLSAPAAPASPHSCAPPRPAPPRSALRAERAHRASGRGAGAPRRHARPGGGPAPAAPRRPHGAGGGAGDGGARAVCGRQGGRERGRAGGRAGGTLLAWLAPVQRARSKGRPAASPCVFWLHPPLGRRACGGHAMWANAPNCFAACAPSWPLPALRTCARICGAGTAHPRPRSLPCCAAVRLPTGEVHLETCIKDLQERFARCQLVVSPPLVAFRWGPRTAGGGAAQHPNASRGSSDAAGRGSNTVRHGPGQAGTAVCRS